ncbi:MAG TPA: hypothetical protein VE981_02700 [Planctomycetota bacterium]|nr:hypothetical protein [Planctomycetota bacterium]
MPDETTSTSLSGEQDPVYTESLTKTLGRPPRKLYFFLQFFALILTLGICWMSARYHERLESMDVEHLSQVTSMAIVVGKMLMTPVGMACAIFIVVGLGLLAIRGAIDGFLKLLIWLNVLWLLGFLLMSTMGFWLPLLKAKQAAGH